MTIKRVRKTSKRGERKAMKTSFYKSRFAVLVQIILWVFILILMVVLFFYRGDYSGEDIKDTIELTLFFEALISLTAPIAMQKIKFTETYMAVKIGPFNCKKLYYSDIKFIKAYEISSGQYLLNFIFFSDRYLTPEEAARCFDKNSFFSKDKVIFCDYPQKGMDELLIKLFPKVFNIQK